MFNHHLLKILVPYHFSRLQIPSIGALTFILITDPCDVAPSCLGRKDWILSYIGMGEGYLRELHRVMSLWLGRNFEGRFEMDCQV
jgi:hypothetical protein